MGPAVSALAFPRPLLDEDFYQSKTGAAWATGGLLLRKDLLFLTTDRGEKVPAVFIKSKGAKYTILWSHGNAEDLGLILDEMDYLAHSTGCNVLAYDYVGYSTSRIQEGRSPSEAGCIRSVNAAWEHLVTKEDVSPDTIIIIGRSIGSGPAVDLASRHTDSAGVLLVSPITSGAWVLFGRRAASAFYYADIFRNYEKIGRITAPVAIVHGTADEVVPVECGHYLYSNSKKKAKCLWIEGKGHNDMPPDQVEGFIAEFVFLLAATAPADAVA